MNTPLKTLLLALAILPVLALIGGAFGSVHPLGDSLAVFRFHFGVLSLLSAVFFLTAHWRKAASATTILAVAAVGSILWHGLAPKSSIAAGYALYQKNLFFRLGSPDALIADIQNSGADFVTLQEVSLRNTAVLDGLKTQFPTQLRCDFSSVGGTAVASRFPAVEGTQTCANGLSAVQVTSDQGPLWLASIHLHWPYPHNQARHVGELLSTLSTLNGPVLLGGDFNMVPWSYTMSQIETATGSGRIGHINGTFTVERTVTLPIDHILAPQGCAAQVENRGNLGSDHQGVLGRFPASCLAQ